jgi:hypothetical protein
MTVARLESETDTTSSYLIAFHSKTVFFKREKFSVIVHFNYFWNFRVFSDASGRPPTSFPTIQTLCK